MIDYDDQKFIMELPAFISKDGSIEIDYDKEGEDGEL